uniref:C2H2-type domain-containing protein n=1 Tax=Amphiprion ocellaris TaxID=80972 RepID=A0AAQ5X7K9_AMPOC
MYICWTPALPRPCRGSNRRPSARPRTSSPMTENRVVRGSCFQPDTIRRRTGSREHFPRICPRSPRPGAPTMLSWTRGAPMEPDSLDTMSKSDILRGIIVEKLSTAAREILAVVERTVTDYEEEASGFRQEIDRQRRQLELLQPEIKQETSEEQQIFPVSETRGVEPLEEEELHKYKPSEGDTESLGIVCYTEQQVEEEEHEDEEEVEVDEDEEEEEEDQASLSSAPEPEYEAAPRLAPPSAPSDRRSVGRPRISDSQTLIDLRIRILEDSDIDVLSTGVFRKYPAHELQCPRGLQEEDFLELLRSSFPQLADGEPFDVFTTDRTKRLLPLEVDSLTPDEINQVNRTNRNSALFIRLKTRDDVDVGENNLVPLQSDAAEDLPSFSEQTYRSPVHQGELGSNVLSNSSTSHPEHVEPEDGDDGEESSNLWFLMPSESDDVSDGEDDWRPRTSDERIRNGESDRTPGKQQLKARRTKQTASPLAEHSDTQLSCKVCRILRGSMNMLIKHAWSHVNERERICGVCGDQSESTEQLRSHLQTHQKTHSCNICGKSFITVSGFRGHIARHKGNTPYKCKICHKAFTEKSVLMNHRWVHTKDKPHKCDVCHKSYLSKLKLRDHRSTHTGGKLYGCNMCGKRFRSLDTLSGHMVLHSGHTAVRERRCVCEVCGKKFSTDKNLRIHMKNHSEDRPFACSKCNKSFSFKSNLATHMRVHTGEKPYQCPVCGKTFSQNHCVKRHLLKHRVQEMSPINGAAY